jgi:hypothetical protein
MDGISKIIHINTFLWDWGIDCRFSENTETGKSKTFQKSWVSRPSHTRISKGVKRK